MHGWRLAIPIPSYSREAATPASSLASRSRSSNRSAVSIIARAEEAAQAASSLTPAQGAFVNARASEPRSARARHRMRLLDVVPGQNRCRLDELSVGLQ